MANELIKVTEVTNLLSQFPDIVGRNSKSVENCNNVGQTILDTIDAEGMNEDLDAKASEYIDKVRVTMKNMNSRRTPFTQIFDKIRSHFTSQEKAIDPKDLSTIPGKIVAARNKYAQKKHEEAELRRKETERRAAYEQEKATYRQNVENGVNAHFSRYLQNKINELHNIYNTLTFATFDRDSIGITIFSNEYKPAHFEAYCEEYTTYYLSKDDKQAIRKSVLNGKFETFAAKFKTDISLAKQDIIDRLPSKRAELQEVEELRKRDAVAAQAAEEERKQREALEAKKRLEEIQRQEEEDKQKAAMQAQQASMTNLFDASAATVAAPPTNAKVKEKIQVLHPQGFLEIFQMWWLGDTEKLWFVVDEEIQTTSMTCCDMINCCCSV